MATFQFPKIVFGPEFDAKVDGVSTRIRIVGCSDGAYLIKNVSEDKIYKVKPGLSLSGDSFEFEGAISTPAPEPDPEPTPDPDPDPDPETPTDETTPESTPDTEPTEGT